MPNESLDPNYALGYYHDPSRTSRATALSTTVTVDIGAPGTVLAAAVINTNANFLRVRNQYGLSQVITIPSWDAENRPVFGWADVSGSPVRTAQIWYFDMSKVTTFNMLEFGQLWLVTAWDDVELLYGLERGHDRPGNIVSYTKLGHKHVQRGGIKTQQYSGIIKNRLALPQWETIEAEMAGIGYSSLLLPYHNQNRVVVVDIVDVKKFRHTHEEGDVMTYQLQLEELATGDVPRLA